MRGLYEEPRFSHAKEKATLVSSCSGDKIAGECPLLLVPFYAWTWLALEARAG